MKRPKLPKPERNVYLVATGKELVPGFPELKVTHGQHCACHMCRRAA